MDYHKNNALKKILHLPGSAAYDRQKEGCVCLCMCVSAQMYAWVPMCARACHTYTSAAMRTWAKHVGGYPHTLKETWRPHAACTSHNTTIKKPQDWP